MKYFESIAFAVAALLIFPALAGAQVVKENAPQVRELGMAASVAPTSAPVTGTSDVVGSGAEMGSGAPSGPELSSDFINFGYLQNNGVLPYLQWESLTHIAAPFVDFQGDGTLYNPQTFTGRNSALKSGGAAQRAGTKVILCVRNRSFDETVLTDVMTNSAKRALLVTEVVNLVQNDSYCAGVNFDFEFSWGATTRDGITAFIQEMRAVLPVSYELSIYTHAYYSTTRWDIPNLVNNIDYMLYSTYDFATGFTPHAIADFNSCLPQLAKYMDAGLPAKKLVLTWVRYGRMWAGTNQYNSAGNYKQSQGFYDGLYDTTLSKLYGGPQTSQYVRGDEVGWFTFKSGGQDWVKVWETPESLEYKIASAMNFPGSNGAYAGVRLGGVGWWSLMWTSNYFDGFDSYDPISNSEVSRAPYYRHVDLLTQEILKKPNQKSFVLESFENENDHWRDPNESPDTSGDTDNNSTFSHQNAPSGVGRPDGTTKAGRLVFDFESASGNKVFLRHEILNNASESYITDANAALAVVSKNTRFTGSYYTSGNYSARNMRLALIDGKRSIYGKPQVEFSDARSLPTTSGWHTFTWDVNDPAQITAGTTTEPALENGNGVINTSGPGVRDISFLGFIIEGGSAGAGTIYFDDLRYEDHAPDNKAYVINEFRYADTGKEFVEIAGPAGPFPSDMQLVSYNSTNGSIENTISLSGKSIPVSGLYVIGDSGVDGASGSTGFTPPSWSVGPNLPTRAPSAIQLYGSTTGFVFDSVVYSAFGGIQDLSRIQTRRVSGEGYPWLGNIASGTDTNNQPYTMGRLPDGADTNVNHDDFSFMPPTPGQPNGGSVDFDTPIDFSSLPAGLFQTYRDIRLEDPTAAGIPVPSGNGQAYRCVDTTGGGVVGVFGDALTGSGRGIDVTGQLYIPAANQPAQAVAVGFCGTQGTTFFSDSPQNSGYENGYWLIYENGTVNLNDGQPNHDGQFQFVMASNDNQDANATVALGTNKSLAQLSAAKNTWVNFHLRINPSASAAEQLVVQINGIDVYHGAIPAGGRTFGPFMTGFRETDNNVSNVEGTWIDNLLINYSSPPAGVDNYELY